MSDVWLDDQFDLEHTYTVSAVKRCIGAQAHWQAQADIQQATSLYESLLHEAVVINQRFDDKHQSLNAILDCFYGQWGFSGSQQDVPEFRLNSVYFTLLYRTGNSLALGIVLHGILADLGFDADMVLVDHAVMVQVNFSAQEHYLIEPTSGQQLWHLQPENDEPEQGHELLVDEEIYKLYLAHQKWAFIAAERFGSAFACAELLLEISGDDPYERRDRGYLLNQINRPELAKEDLRFFVDECPDDPGIDIVRHQIDELENNNNTLH
ncbi:tetratricopeptide repeat protein [Pseudoalteromonas sp. SSDWG2]|uniref:tetratricopeptide repeat protein n=1 Tax=Pseudoalteromonas sp. SSDWG2 TaxID=3139391 RepID=UPI003BAD3AB4